MRVLFFVAVIAGSTFAATIPPQIDSNNVWIFFAVSKTPNKFLQVFEMSATPVSDTFDVIYNQVSCKQIMFCLVTPQPFDRKF